MSQIRQTLKQLKHNHPYHGILGLAMIGIGLILISNKHYFFWPPFAAYLLNDDLVGGTFIAVGIGLINWAMSNKSKISTNRNLLIATAVLLAISSTAEFCHAIFGYQPFRYTTGLVELILLMIDYVIINNSKKHNY